MTDTAPQTRPASDPAQSTDGLAIAGFATSFVFWPAGLVLNPLALNNVKKNGKQGRGLAIAGLWISIAGFLVTTLLVVAAVLLAARVLPLAEQQLRAALGGPITISDGVTANADGLSCAIVEYSHVTCDVRVSVTNSRDEAITVGPEEIVAASRVDVREATSLTMQPSTLTVQPGVTAHAVISVRASDELEWFERGLDFDDVVEFSIP